MNAVTCSPCILPRQNVALEQTMDHKKLKLINNKNDNVC